MKEIRLALLGSVLSVFVACAESQPPPGPVAPAPSSAKQETPPPQMTEQKRKDIASALWNTPLGRLYHNYLFAERPYEDFPPLSRQIVLKIYSDRSQVAARIGALSILTGNLYARGEMTQDALARITILQSDIYQQAEKQRQEIKRTAAHQAAVFFVAAIPLGSPLVRQQISNAATNVGVVVRRLTRGERERFEKIEFQRMLSRDVFTGYRPSSALNAFVSSFGPYAMVYFFYEEWMAPSVGREAGEISMIYGLDELMMAMAL